MPVRSESRVIAGLNDYRFVASLHVQHPLIDPDDVTSTLGLNPRSLTRRGQQRCRPDGQLLTGKYAENHWSVDLQIISGQDVPEFLEHLVDRQIAHALDWTRQVDDSGGSVTVFVGLFAERCCDFEIPALTLRRLGNAGITVRLDYYGAENGERAIKAEQSDGREQE